VKIVSRVKSFKIEYGMTVPAINSQTQEKNSYTES